MAIGFSLAGKKSKKIFSVIFKAMLLPNNNKKRKDLPSKMLMTLCYVRGVIPAYR